MKKKLLISIAAAVVVVVTVVCILLFRPVEETYRNIKIYKIEGTSEIIRNNESLEAYEQMVLRNNDEIVVSDESNLILILDNDKYVCLESNTKIKLISSEKDSSKTIISLLEGKIIAEVKEKLKDGENFEI